MNLSNAVKYAGAATLGKPVLYYQKQQNLKRIEALAQKNDPHLSPPLKANARMSQLLSEQYLKGRFTEGVRKVAWHSSGAPIEILQTLDFFLYTPDNHAAMCGARKLGAQYCEIAENKGYSRDICSYARTDIGSFLSGKTPVGRLPKPDLIVVSNNICQTILHWYQAMGVYYNAPVFVIDTPFLYGDAKAHDVAFVKQQMEELIPVAEKISGKRFSRKKFHEICRRGKLCSDLWCEVLYRAKHKPAPLSGFDAFILMGPVVALRGEVSSIDFYHEVLKEIDERIDKGIGVVKNEKYRILWDNLPIWYRISWFSKQLAALGISVAISNYTYQWAEPAQYFDLVRPMEGAAKTYLHSILNRSAGYKLHHMEQMVEDFSLDGVLFHSDRSCKPYSLGQMDQSRAMLDNLGLPCVTIESDHNDERVFSEGQISTRLQAFAEMLG